MKAFSILSALVILLAGCSDDVEDIVNDQYKVSGTIMDSVTHQPMAGVQVRLLEDREPFINGGTELHNLTTGADGRYSMDFKWKDSPYEVYVHKPGYRYVRLIPNKITNDTLRVTYQNVEFGEHQSTIDFRMALNDHLMVRLRNAEPRQPDDRIEFRLRRTRTGPVVSGPVYEVGITERDLYLGLHPVGSYVYLDYKITQNGLDTQHLDSVLIETNTLLSREVEF